VTAFIEEFFDNRLHRYRSRRFRLTTLETKDIIARLRDDNPGGTIVVAGVTYYVMRKWRTSLVDHADYHALHAREGTRGVFMERTNQGVLIMTYDDSLPVAIAPSLQSVLPVSSAIAVKLPTGQVAQHSISVGYCLGNIATHIRTGGS
jgi:hypothetical protein